MRIRRRKKEKACTQCRDDLIPTSARLFDVNHQSYGFSGDLIRDHLTYEYQCCKTDFSRSVYKLHCYV